MRASGVLLPVFSLPGEYGIGCFSSDARRFIDFLAEAGQTYWQILPLGPTGVGDSPYQSFSTFAGNPYFISPDILVKKGLLTEKECRAYDFGQDGSRVDYQKLYKSRICLLEKAFERADLSGREYREFLQKNDFWLADYALFMSLKDVFRGKPFTEWESSYRKHEEKVLEEFKRKHEKKIALYQYIQYEFFCQWNDLKSYANAKGIQIIGDIPIYVSADGADVWGCPEAFQLDKESRVTAVAGCPPDSFSKEGQLWGNPLYNWSYHRKSGYIWWIRRFEKCLELYDIIRIDHFRGFDEYYSIPAGNQTETAEYGAWKKGPGIELFKALEDRFGKVPIIAEDLGFMTPGVKKLVRDTGFPNMKILQFAFNSLAGVDGESGVNEHLPYRYEKNCVVYTGTHDNETLAGYLQQMEPGDKKHLLAYCGLSEESTIEEMARSIIRMAHASTADYCIIPLADYLYLDNSARINEPATLGKNWMWRLDREMLTRKLAEEIRGFTELYERVSQRG